MTPQRFDEQLRWIQEKGYETLTLDDVVNGLSGERSFSSPSVALTFDDGYRNNWDHAFPALQKWKMKAMIYLVTERIGLDGYLSWDQVKAMRDSGLVSFGSHTHTHRGFVRKTPYDNIENELRLSKELIEKNLGAPCTHLAWPWGDYETSWLPLVKKLGYQSAATTLGGANASGSNPYELRRINIRHAAPEWLEPRLRWNETALSAAAYGVFYGWDRRLKVWWNRETPYAHG